MSDPWNWEKNFNEQESHKYYPWFSQRRNGKYAGYFGDVDYYLNQRRQTHKPESVAKYYRIDPNTGWEWSIKQTANYQDFKRMGISEFIRGRKVYPDNQRKTYWANLRWGQYFCIKKKSWFDLLPEMKAHWRDLTTEQRIVWHWMSFINGGDEKPTGWTQYCIRYMQNKEAGLPKPIWPEMFPIEPMINPEINRIEVDRSASGKAKLIVFWRWEMFGNGQLMRTRIYPSVRKSGIGTMVDKFKWYGQYPYVGKGMFYMCNAIKPQPYEFTCYAVNDWGGRVNGENFIIPCHHKMIWLRDWWNVYYDFDDKLWCECTPPTIYDYGGTW